MSKQSHGQKVIRETCVAGATMDVSVKMSPYSISGKRAPKGKPTTEAVMKNNDRLAVRNLTRLINTNFYPGDFHITLTYAEVVSRREAEQILKRFLRRMRAEFRKREKELYYIAVTEYESHRIHHHIVMSYIDEQVIYEQWMHGYVKFSTLDRSRNYRRLAEYLIKETQKTFRDPSNATKRRWSGSRNLKRPVVKREMVSMKQLFDDPKPLKGYEIDQDTIRRFEHPCTRLEHLEYMMVSTDPVPRIRTWRKGKIINRQETYMRAEQLQIDMSSLDGWSTV